MIQNKRSQAQPAIFPLSIYSTTHLSVNERRRFDSFNSRHIFHIVFFTNTDDFWNKEVKQVINSQQSNIDWQCLMNVYNDEKAEY